MKLAVIGANGRMGRAVVRLAHEAGMSVVCAIGNADIGKDAGELAGIGAIGALVSDDLETLRTSKPDALVDFSAPAALARAAAIAAEAGIAIASGTTGLDGAANAGLEAATQKVPVLWEPNTSACTFCRSSWRAPLGRSAPGMTSRSSRLITG
jgi:4-hydroxy-tetrahydrodipicolinate reductase